MKIISAQDRLNRRRGSHLVIVGPSGVGKTYQARMLRDQQTTVFVDNEAGTLAIDGEVTLPDGTILPPFMGSVIEGVRTWDHMVAIATLIGGPNPIKEPGQNYSQNAYDAIVQRYPNEAAALRGATTIYWDSLTGTSRACWEWVKKQPRCINGKGAFDTFAAYRYLGDEMIELLKHIQSRVDLNIVFACILEPDKTLQVLGQMTPRELPGVFDTIVSLVPMVNTQSGVFLADGAPPELERFRAFVCGQLNPFGLPAKDRSGRLAMLERPDLGALLAKLSGQPTGAAA